MSSIARIPNVIIRYTSIVVSLRCVNLVGVDSMRKSHRRGYPYDSKEKIYRTA